MKKQVIAIDGPAASGKSTVARLLAERLSIPYINTGNMYRAITYYMIETGNDPACVSEEKIKSYLQNLSLDYVKDENGKYELELNGTFPGLLIRSPKVAENVSRIAAMPSVREWLLSRQRSLASIGLIVMEGRDIGTVIFPEAAHKFFLTASPEVRAARRLAQEGETLDGATVESVAEEIRNRDSHDMNRTVAPLKKADDSVLIDSSRMTINEVIDSLIRYIGSEER